MSAIPALIELQCFPSIQYFSKFLLYPTIILEQKESYRKGSYRNRWYIASANGPLRLSIPLVRGKNQQQAIRDVRISYAETWQNKHWTAIQSAYGKAPYFEYYADDLLPFFTKKYHFLFEYNLAILDYFLNTFQLTTTVEFSQTFLKTSEHPIIDLRNTIHPSKPVEDHYFQIVPYPQVFQEKTGFIPTLSILDLLFCQGPETIITLQRSNIKTN